MDMSPEERQRNAEYFRQVRSGLQTFYRWFLYVLTALIAGFAIYLYLKWRHDPNWTFLSAYFGILLILFALWVVSQLRSVASKPSSSAPSSGGIAFSRRMETDKETGARKITLRLGSEPEANDSGKEPEKGDFTTSFGVKLSSLPPEVRPDDVTLRKAGELLAQGMNLDSVCSQIQPEFLQWGSVMQRVYKAYLQGFLELRRFQGESTDQTSASATTSAGAAVTSSPSVASQASAPSLPAGPMVQRQMDGFAKGESEKELSRAPRWTVFILILTAIFAAAFTAGLIFLKKIHS
jgi:hypothetical protein